MANLMENYFAGMNIPSRSQLNAVGERLTAIETELGETKAMLNQLLTASKVADAAAQPASALDTQLSEIKALVNQMLNAAPRSNPGLEAAAALEAELRETKAALKTELGEIRGLLNQLSSASKTADAAPQSTSALEDELREIRAALGKLLNGPTVADAGAKAAEAAPRPARSRGKRPGGTASGARSGADTDEGQPPSGA